MHCFMALTLHSTMFLLIQQLMHMLTILTFFFTFHNVSINTSVRFSTLSSRSSFTFHNVSINTSSDSTADSFTYTLHSTMFLLIRFVADGRFCSKISFTFHNVSINTFLPILAQVSLLSLHSTMFLLIPC